MPAPAPGMVGRARAPLVGRRTPRPRRTGGGAARPERRARRAAGGDEAPAAMTAEEAMEALGVKEDASFDDIVAAKNRKLKAKGGGRGRDGAGVRHTAHAQ